MKRMKSDENKEERFKRVAEARTNTVIDKLRLLGNCSNKRIYSYTEEDINKIFSAINKQFKKAREKFNSPKAEKFRLK